MPEMGPTEDMEQPVATEGKVLDPERQNRILQDVLALAEAQPFNGRREPLTFPPFHKNVKSDTDGEA
ncbi:MAG: hypothetical protein ACXWLH_06250 [Candidatus Saccharimonadales bacterium]